MKVVCSGIQVQVDYDKNSARGGFEVVFAESLSCIGFLPVCLKMIARHCARNGQLGLFHRVFGGSMTSVVMIVSCKLFVVILVNVMM